MLILGDMLELGEWSAEAHQNILRKADTVAHEAILVCKEFATAYGVVKGELEGDYRLYPTTVEALNDLKHKPLDGALILLKGSRGIALEKLIEKL